MSPAALRYEDRIYFSQEPMLPGPFTAVTELIQSIYEQEPLWARKILRHRIYSTKPLTPLCYGMIKVAARKFSQVSDLSTVDELVALPKDTIMTPHFFSLQTREPSGQLSDFETRSDWMSYAKQLAADLQNSYLEKSSQRYERDRAIVAVLISPEGQLLSAARNTNSINKTLHAEVNLIQSYFLKYKAKLPVGSAIYSTLKPCRMCAGMIWQWSEDPLKIQVYYGEHDAGSNANITILDADSREQTIFTQLTNGIQLESLLEVESSK